uniref:Uncharacterized protein n=1 Tax=Chromera velia CCMP2878 TaxID=1169474 RepID=A0A0G4FGD2_9ALVE|eukprot:Cvel_16820.t1-p1 / transcript=Cvel_16820.t1 / gene=Cvel_16820 / organism=Chromera_velia_CCMP2878 / gene_product=hypothetical protein / transcript_product=hypothetical protein / location=Cvel_scaffold1313:36202-39393(-) / protein_length=346 / sequence_SO=supercontig / SO=protein_coding / is_pseudo=false
MAANIRNRTLPNMEYPFERLPPAFSISDPLQSINNSPREQEEPRIDRMPFTDGTDTHPSSSSRKRQYIGEIADFPSRPVHNNIMGAASSGQTDRQLPNWFFRSPTFPFASDEEDERIEAAVQGASYLTGSCPPLPQNNGDDRQDVSRLSPLPFPPDSPGRFYSPFPFGSRPHSPMPHSPTVSGDKDTEELLEALNQDPHLEVLQGNGEDRLIDLSTDDSDMEGDTLVVTDITDSLDSHYESANKLEEFVDKFLKVGSVAKTREEVATNIFALMKEHREALGFKYEGSHKGEGASKSFNQLWFGGTLSSLEIAKEGRSVHPTLDPNCFCRGSVVQILDQGQPLWVVL